MAASLFEINAQDCSPFKFECKDRDCITSEDCLRKFSDSFLEDHSIFHISTKRDENANPFACYNYKDRQWWAGRWVGSTKIEGKPNFKINVVPRFGNTALFSMFEEIFSINILENPSSIENGNISEFIKLLIPLIWANKLNEANRYGVPRSSIDVIHKGSSVKGRLLVRPSIRPFFIQNEVVSASREKQVDATICRIVLRAYNIINNTYRKNYLTGMSENAQEAIRHFQEAGIQDTPVSEHDYRGIRYRAIYASWREIVDFSWKIIKHHDFGQRESDTQKGYGLFIDMAEIWEMYLRSLLKHQFPDWKVWTIEESTIETYTAQFFGRKIIPDIVMERGDEVMVFDAKWKRMKFEKDDVDRGDFFQIHTYMQYFHALGKKVKVGGLLYPISMEDMGDRTDYHSLSFFGLGTMNIPFVVDGICFGEEKSLNEKTKYLTAEEIEKHKNAFTEQVDNFIDRIREFAN